MSTRLARSHVPVHLRGHHPPPKGLAARLVQHTGAGKLERPPEDVAPGMDAEVWMVVSNGFIYVLTS